MKRLEEHAATMVCDYYVLKSPAAMILTYAAARNSRGTEPITYIVRFSGVQFTRSSESGKHSRRSCGNIGGVGVFFTWDEGSSIPHSISSG